MKSISFILFIFCLATTGLASVSSRTNSGIKKTWNGVALTMINVYTPSYDASKYGSADVMSIVSEAGNRWSERGGMMVLPVESIEGPSPQRNDLYFSSSYEGLGTGVLGLTVTTTDESTGSITEADIIINSAYSYTANQLKDVITHEMGHFLGLGHSPINGATMHYQWVSGQRELSLDDVTGIAAKYPKFSNLTGTISGRVIGGVDATGVFGVQVLAISEEYGKVMGSTISEQDGTFEINGLLRDRTYYLYIAPLKNLDSLPIYFETVKNNFCDENSDFTGSFFEGCSKTYEGRPQPVYLASSINVGDATIHCGLSVPNDYYHAKSDGMELLNEDSSGFGDSTVGYFTTSEVSGQDSDTYVLDLRDRTDILGKSVKINILSRALLNPLYFRARVMDENNIIIAEDYSALTDVKDWTKGDVQLEFNLSSIAENNLFYVKVTAISSSIFNLDGAYWSVADLRPFYFMNLYFTDGIDASIDGPTTVLGGGDSRVRLEDEYMCPQGENVHSYYAEVDLSALGQSDDGSGLPMLNCATIAVDDQGGGPSGGLGSLLIGFSFMFFLSFFLRRENGNI